MTQKMIIPVPALEVRATWQSIGDLPFSDEVLFEIVQRYFDTQDHAITYRKKSALKAAALKKFALENGFDSEE